MSRRDHSMQHGFTLVELIIALAIGSLLMVAVTSVVLTAWRGVTVASSRVEASAEVRNFEYVAYNDFAASGLPTPTGCGTAAVPCTTQPLVLNGFRASNSTSPTPTAFQVTYALNGSNLDRTDTSTSATRHIATDVGAGGFSWYVDTNATVVVNLTVTVQAYSESQTFRFYPRLNP